MPKIVPVLIPPLDLGETELRLGVWHCRDGRPIREGDRLLEIIAGDVVVDLSAPADGILRKLAAEEDLLTVAQVVGELLQ